MTRLHRRGSLVLSAVATDKRARQKANKRARLEEQRRLEQRDNLTQRVLGGGLLLALIIAGGLLFWFARDNDVASEDNSFTPELTSSTTEAPEPDAPQPVALSAPTAGETIEGETPCPADDGSSDRTTTFESAPPMCIDETATYQAVIETTKGTLTVELDPARAPLTVNNFVVLSRYHYYEGVPFHRVIPGFMVQGGDAVGDPLGTGGPGYTVADELPEEGEYMVGSIAMANAGPDTNGSQFFIVTGDLGVALPPNWSIFGEVSEGLDVVLDIEATGTEGGPPIEETLIESITISES